MKTYIGIYTPVTHSNGERLVQVCSGSFKHFVGWTDGLGKFDRKGTWQVDDNWSPSQNAEYAKAVQAHQENMGKNAVKTDAHKDGISRVVRVKY